MPGQSPTKQILTATGQNEYMTRPIPKTKLLSKAQLARLRAGMTLEMLAKRARLVPGTLRAYERSGCGYATADRLSRKLNASIMVYLRGPKVEIPYKEYIQLKAAAEQNQQNETRPRRQ